MSSLLADTMEQKDVAIHADHTLGDITRRIIKVSCPANHHVASHLHIPESIARMFVLKSSKFKMLVGVSEILQQAGHNNFQN